jgi:hypothetical protein
MRVAEFWLGASGARARVVPPGARRGAAVEAQLAEPQGWLACAYDKNFAGRNTKTSGIKPRIVLRASAIGRCKLAVLLNAPSAFDRCTRQARASVIGGVVRGCARPRLAGATRGKTIGLSIND